ncbi:MAG: class I SAM-dependent methyltransferase [Candidatus Aenigmarchaeota archaeon]|nr:class I SAM-dependent methyltransferase [Candidatus Aenigmarchaeota archaeon]
MNEINVKAWDKTAKDYFTEVVSPFAKGVENPIYWYIEKKVDYSKRKSVIDIGTGIGNLLPFLSKEFKEVVALDISPKMIEKAKKNAGNLENVKLLVKDARDLKEFYNQFDVAVSVNSILLPEIKSIEKILLEIYNVLNDDGVFIGIFPSMDALLYRAVLEHEKAIEDGDDEKTALEKTLKAIDADKFDFVLGTFKYHDMVQKHYYKFELMYRLWKAGFKNIRMRKVFYPWEVYEDEDLLEFKGKPELWDWFIFAEKKV